MRAFSDSQLPLHKAEQLESEIAKHGLNCAVGAALVRGSCNSFDKVISRANGVLSFAKVKHAQRFAYDFDGR